MRQWRAWPPRSSTAARTMRGAGPTRRVASRSGSAGWQCWISPRRAASRCCRPTGATPASSTVRSTTIANCAPSSYGGAPGFAARRTRRSSWRRSPPSARAPPSAGCGGCSRSPSGTGSSTRCCSREIDSARSRCMWPDSASQVGSSRPSSRRSTPSSASGARSIRQRSRRTCGSGTCRPRTRSFATRGSWSPERAVSCVSGSPSKASRTGAPAPLLAMARGRGAPGPRRRWSRNSTGCSRTRLRGA